jgi:hypothetical protein
LGPPHGGGLDGGMAGAEYNAVRRNHRAMAQLIFTFTM